LRGKSRAVTVTVRVGFVGAGNVARRHVATLLGLGEVEVAAVADPDVERARALAASAGRGSGPGNAVAVYGDHLRMLEREELDALYVCVPPFAHGPPELAAVEAGLPLFVEKPIAIDLDTAETIAAAVRERGLVTAAGYHWRNLETFERALELLHDRPARLVVASWLDKVPPVAWWCRRDGSGGQIVEQATHAIDLARALVGEVTQVYAAESRTERAAFPDADVNDVSAATLRFASGAVGSLSSTCLLGWKHRASVQVFSDGLALEVSEEALVVDTGSGPRAWPDRGDAKVRVDRDFIDAVKGGLNRVRVPYQEALRTHRVACALARSAEEGRPVELTPAGAHA
jgi:predicted dehydrogenase